MGDTPAAMRSRGCRPGVRHASTKSADAVGACFQRRNESILRQKEPCLPEIARCIRLMPLWSGLMSKRILRLRPASGYGDVHKELT